MLRADAGYWISMFIAGTLGTVIGDYCSHDLHLGDGGASLLLVPILALVFVIARNGLLRSLPYYWLTIVTVRAAGTAVGDFVAGRNMLGLPWYAGHGHAVRCAACDVEGTGGIETGARGVVIGHACAPLSAANIPPKPDRKQPIRLSHGGSLAKSHAPLYNG